MARIGDAMVWQREVVIRILTRYITHIKPRGGVAMYRVKVTEENRRELLELAPDNLKKMVDEYSVISTWTDNHEKRRIFVVHLDNGNRHVACIYPISDFEDDMNFKTHGRWFEDLEVFIDHDGYIFDKSLTFVDECGSMERALMTYNSKLRKVKLRSTKYGIRLYDENREFDIDILFDWRRLLEFEHNKTFDVDIVQYLGSYGLIDLRSEENGFNYGIRPFG